MREEKVPYLMLFCTLILVKRNKATLAESARIVPQGGKAGRLATELLKLSLMKQGKGGVVEG